MKNSLGIGIAEDHEEVRLALKKYLTEKNKVEKASAKPVICIVDANMAVMDGIKTVSILEKSFLI